ncbi:type I glyceraldehyde-3-phosphate dehydrogenase [bacterium]|jgi:glyceraldehyde 3-phosphate dehydrogenase|nr:type I glyceraldehyde-3-phosphate dehydrogenase [Pelagibacteraceae bacterium]MDC3130778.1 type I glyceraldehyde-3-phosphate dehydrogenase [bacterium]
MAINVAISGFGRIGRLVLRSIIENKRKDINIVAINDLAPIETNAFLLSYDSIHGPLKEKVNIKNEKIIIGNKKILALKERDPKNLPWKKLKIDIVFECTGLFTSKDTASMHLKAGAKKVLVSAPCNDADKTIVYGVNHNTLTKKDIVVSNASCTTNCLAPVTKVLNDNFGIVHGYMTTIHAYTGDQKVLDTFHSDPRRARAAALSMIPTSTGAAKAVGLVMPELAGKLDGTAIRVPTPNVSLIDFKFVTKKKINAESINKAMIKASKSKNLKNVLSVNSEPLVSTDFNHNPASSNFDLTQTQVIDGTFGRVLSWYDNEWGFSNRMCDTAVVMSKSK